MSTKCQLCGMDMQHHGETCTTGGSQPPPVPESAGLRYALGAIEKLQWMAGNPPGGILAGNVSSQLLSCSDTIKFEIEYCNEREIQ